MKVILTSDVENLGEPDDVADVADGYARNYLIPQGLAIKATPGALKELKVRQAAEARREQRLASRADALSEQLSEITLVFEAKANEETGRLFGSITTDDIAEALKREVGEKFDRRKHILSDPLRKIGKHSITIRLTPDVEVEVEALVKPEGGEIPEAFLDETEEEGEEEEETSPAEEITTVEEQ